MRVFSHSPFASRRVCLQFFGPRLRRLEGRGGSGGRDIFPARGLPRVFMQLHGMPPLKRSIRWDDEVRENPHAPGSGGSLLMEPQRGFG